MNIIRRMLALLLALLCATACLAEEAAVPTEEELLSEELAAGEVAYTEVDALAEENALEAFELQPGDYEWYILPAEPIDGAAYIDVYPAWDITWHADGSWSYSFTLEEVTGISYQPYVLTIIAFSADRQELTRTPHLLEELATWWANNAVLCSSAVIYEGTVTAPDIAAIAVSIIGIDEYGNEQEFHSLLDIREIGVGGTLGETF